MKTMFFVSLIVLCTSMFSQSETNEQFEKLDSISLVNKTKQMIKLETEREFTEPKWVTSHSDSYMRLVYFRKDLQENKEEADYDSCKECITFVFEKYMLGENKELEIKGKEAYGINYIKGKYLDVFDIWKGTFRPDASKETCMNDYKFQNLYNSKRRKLAYFSGDDGIWELRIF